MLVPLNVLVSTKSAPANKYACSKDGYYWMIQTERQTDRKTDKKQKDKNSGSRTFGGGCHF